ncbi:DNA polymerase III subunit epsilon [Flavobacterium akiainvivens]|uniref:DNA polymerase III subunit epsilon n=1 Tax=Flavobacterium akiainvivens TaxID=1202724 RepID=A0A0M9VHE9_9FLAO|nr:3'-5' exonuclease [Flavobacterium akiainvivens]KOS05232.1 DNA polymerase III subunit epsilon [Flavobacterium akiainvivens]SFQ50386.1 DNA polymerase-3 subunit epsilon [Flavobacterium akiainvivens]
MAFDWITGGSLPQFWKNYTSFFEDDNNALQKKYVVFDMDATGLDWKEDVILSIVALGVDGDAINVGEFIEIYIQQDKYTSNSIAAQGIVNNGAEKVVEAEAMIQFLNFAKDAVLVGHNVNLDIEMINQALKRLGLGRLKNQFMDTNVLYQKLKDLPDGTKTGLDEICDALKIDKNERNTISGNTYSTALAFIKMKKKLDI